MRKSDIQFHSDGAGWNPHPAINVKQYQFGPIAATVAARFGCDEKTAERALSFAWESAVDQFWREFADDIVPDIFPGAKCYSEGRGGGWLTVHGLPDVEAWDSIMLGKWAKLCRMVREEIKYLRSDDKVLEDIDVNQWAKAGSELYNFIDGKDGNARCIADLKAEAIAAGYGPVIREGA